MLWGRKEVETKNTTDNLHVCSGAELKEREEEGAPGRKWGSKIGN